MRINLKSSHLLIILCIVLTAIIIFQHVYFVNEISRSETKQENTFISKSYQKEITNFITANIEQIVKDKHMTGGKWIPTKIEFLNKELVLVYYEDGHAAGHLILKIHKVNNSIEYEKF